MTYSKRLPLLGSPKLFFLSNSTSFFLVSVCVRNFSPTATPWRCSHSHPVPSPSLPFSARVMLRSLRHACAGRSITAVRPNTIAFPTPSATGYINIHPSNTTRHQTQTNIHNAHKCLIHSNTTRYARVDEEADEYGDEYDEDDFDMSEYDDEFVDDSAPPSLPPSSSKSKSNGGKSGPPKPVWTGRSPSSEFGSSGAPIIRAKRPVRGPSLLESKTQANMDGVTIVRSIQELRRVLAILTSPGVRERFHAVDTEVMDIDVRTQSPVGHGRVTCLSIYVGPDVDFGTGPKLWIDTLDMVDDFGTPMVDTQELMLQEMKSYLEDESIYKVWHNYSFDRHVLSNHGIHCKGFGGDTMHMARLENSARDKYALEALSEDFLGQRKRPMKELFSRAKPKKDGTLGKVQELPPVEEIQRDTSFLRDHWIVYSTYDTQSTWEIREVLEKRLKKVEWLPPTSATITSLPNGKKPDPESGRSMFDFYMKYWRPFGEMLCDLETEGIWVDAKEFLPKVEVAAEADKLKFVNQFREWAITAQPAAVDMNIHSSTQKQHFFFAGKGIPRKFQIENVEGWIDPNSKTRKPKKMRDFILTGLGMPITDTTAKKMPAVSLAVLKKMAGKIEVDPEIKPKYGTAFDHFAKTEGGGPEAGKRACEAIDALCKVSAVNIMLNTFIKPLQEQADPHGRIHCSLNLNTETGRLSSRKPNLQNQPALEKDIYKIRHAFRAVPGKKFIVADYGQLELRILAHIANCKSMIEAFELGGDFHSRTAMGMYPHVSDAVKRGEVLLEWDKAKNGGMKPTLPMLKDVFAAERRKAKTLNFSIAYGKTARGLAQDWNVTLDEANKTLDAWYRDRPEVKAWQEDTIADAHEFMCTRTLMGRYRPLPLINSRNKGEQKHSERAAINTPIQGGAADVVMKAMLMLHIEPRFRELGWKILLQVHDELICEGPEESAEEALKIVKHTMSNPFKKALRVELVVDAKIGNTWYEAK